MIHRVFLSYDPYWQPDEYEVAAMWQMLERDAAAKLVELCLIDGQWHLLRMRRSEHDEDESTWTRRVLCVDIEVGTVDRERIVMPEFVPTDWRIVRVHVPPFVARLKHAMMKLWKGQ